MQRRTQVQVQAHAVEQCRANVQTRVVFILNLKSERNDLLAQVGRDMLGAGDARQALLVDVKGQHGRYEATAVITGCGLRSSGLMPRLDS